MPQPRVSLPLFSADPLPVSVRRGGAEESLHLVDVALCDGDGIVVMGLGEVERLVFPRSAMKPLQALALAERMTSLDPGLRLTPSELSLICASHNGQIEHVEGARALLERFGLSPDLLSCGSQWSGDKPTMIEQARSMSAPERIHNNCSGKHSGMLVLGSLMGADPAGYADLSHPVQQAILGTLEFMTGIDITQFPSGIDGCGAPALSAPLGSWARGFAMFAGGGQMPDSRTAACARLRDGIAAAPQMIAGDRRMCSAVAAGFGSQITAKTGAEGVYAAAFHDYGLGLMVKARDGNGRASDAALGAVIHALGYDLPDAVRDFTEPELRNWAGQTVGELRIEGPLALS